jgi:hypothetical protein
VNGIVDETSRSRYIARLGAGSNDQSMIAKLQGYGQANLVAGSRGDVDAAIASVQDNVRVKASRLPEIDAWLQRQGK